MKEPAVKWVNWAWDHSRRLRAAVLEWVLMNPLQGPKFLNSVGNDSDFRKTFLGHYHDVEGVMRRLGADPTPPPTLFLDKMKKVKEALELEQRLAELARYEVTAREEQVAFLQDTLDKSCTGDMEALIGYNSRIPALPSRPARKRAAKQVRKAQTAADRCGRKRKRSLSCALPEG